MNTSQFDVALEQGAKIVIKQQQNGNVSVVIGEYDKNEKIVVPHTYIIGDNFEEAVERAAYSYNVNLEKVEGNEESGFIQQDKNELYYNDEENEDCVSVMQLIADENRDYYLNGGKCQIQMCEEDKYIKNLEMILGKECSIDALLKNGYELDFKKSKANNQEIVVRIIRNNKNIFTFSTLSVYHVFRILDQLTTDTNFVNNLF